MLTDPTYKIFVKISESLTGFSSNELIGTGQSELYFEELNEVLGTKKLGKFLKYGQSRSPDDILAGDFGDIARTIISLFYFGQWRMISDLENPKNTSRIVSSQAFRSGLGWQVIGANPPGAKYPGFRSWTTEPRP